MDPCDLLHQPLDQTDLKSRARIFPICACLHGGMLEVSGCTKVVDRPRGIAWHPLWHVGPPTLVWCVLAWCRVGMCRSWHVGTSIWSLVGHRVHVIDLLPLREITTLIQGWRITLEPFTWIMEAWDGWWAHRGGRPTPYGGPTCSHFSISYNFAANTLWTCGTCYLTKICLWYAYLPCILGMLTVFGVCESMTFSSLTRSPNINLCSLCGFITTATIMVVHKKSIHGSPVARALKNTRETWWSILFWDSKLYV
jgi:hypothetical protein